VRFWVKMSDMEKTVFIGEKYCREISAALSAYGCDVFPIPDNPDIDTRLSGHADLSLFYDYAGNLFAANYLRNSSFLEKFKEFGLNICFIDEKQDKIYPCDAQLNVCPVGKSFIYNPKTALPALVAHLEKQGREGIECKQGYTRCSVCVVDDKSIITSDSGIARICRMHGLDVLEIAPGYIVLDGFDYGFIGGASIKLSDNVLAFTGKLTAHPQSSDIISFIQSKSIKIAYLSEYPAFDIGSAHVINT